MNLRNNFFSVAGESGNLFNEIMRKNGDSAWEWSSLGEWINGKWSVGFALKKCESFKNRGMWCWQWQGSWRIYKGRNGSLQGIGIIPRESKCKFSFFIKFFPIWHYKFNEMKRWLIKTSSNVTWRQLNWNCKIEFMFLFWFFEKNYVQKLEGTSHYFCIYIYIYTKRYYKT